MHATILARRRLWLLAGLTAASVATSLLLFGSVTGAQEASQGGDPRVIDPANRCSSEAPPAPFTDRDNIAEVHRTSVDCASAKAITRGRGDGSYTPRAAVRRDQMASFIIRTLEAAGGVTLPAPSSQGFDDVSGNTHEDAINQLAALGIAEGRNPTRYAPAQPVRRDQMASFIMRAANVAFGTTFEATGGPHFADVAGSNVHRANVDAAFELFGLTVGRTASTFVPADPVRRDQMATFLIRLLDIIELTDESTATSNMGLGADAVDDVIGGVESPSDILEDVDAVDGLLDEVGTGAAVGDLLDTGSSADQTAADNDPDRGDGDADTGDGDTGGGEGQAGLGGLIDGLLP